MQVFSNKYLHLFSIIRITLILVLICTVCTRSLAQVPITFTITNCSMDSANRLSFDVTITNNNTAGGTTYRWNAAAFRLVHATGIIPSSGTNTISFGYAGGSDFPNSFPPFKTPAINYNNSTHVMTLSLLNSSYTNSSCSAPPIAPGQTKKIGRFYLRNSQNWVSGQSVGLAFSSSLTSGAVLYTGCATVPTNFNSTTPTLYNNTVACSLNTCSTSSSTINITACNSYTWTTGTGLTYTTSGNYVYHTTNACGLDSAITLHLTINTQNSSSSTTVSYCGTYHWNGNDYSNTGTYVFHTTNAKGCDSAATLHFTNPCNDYSKLNLKVFLQGYYIGNGNMQPVLQNQGIGNISNETDTITVELHNAAGLVESRKGVLNTDGTALLSFSPKNASYYIYIIHRNTIITSSATAISFTPGNTSSFDFTTSASKAYGDNQVQVDPGVFALYTGDLNQDGYIDPFDYPQFDSDNQSFISTVYIASDMNGDGFVDPFDYPIFDANNQSFISSVLPY